MFWKIRKYKSVQNQSLPRPAKPRNPSMEEIWPGPHLQKDQPAYARQGWRGEQRRLR